MKFNDDAMENQTPIVPAVTPQTVVEQPKQSHFLVILLSILLFMSILIAGFFAFQTQKLVNELTLLRTEPTPIATTVPTSDPTADWKTYIDMEYGFEIKYPDQFLKQYLEQNTKLGFRLGLSSIISHDSFSLTVQKTSLSLLDQWVNFMNINVITKSTISCKNDICTKIYPGSNEKFHYISSSIDFRGRKAMKIIVDPQDYIGNEQPFTSTWIIFQLDNEYSILIQTGNSVIANQILSTFKFTESNTDIPAPISMLFDSINKNFNLTLIPTEENKFYSSTGEITKKSWKIDLNEANLGKSFTTYLLTQLKTLDAESGGIGGGGVDAYGNEEIKCFHSYGYRSGDPTNWKDPFNYLSCSEK